RAVSGLSETSTIRGRPARSTWVSRRRSARGARSLAMPVSIAVGPGGRATSVAVQPPQVHPRPGSGAIPPLPPDRQGVRDREGRQHVAPLPSSAAGQPNRYPTLGIADGRAGGVPFRDDPHERAPPRRLRHVLEKHATVDRPDEAIGRPAGEPPDRR